MEYYKETLLLTLSKKPFEVMVTEEKANELTNPNSKVIAIARICEESP